MVRDTPESCEFLSLDNWQKKFLWSNKEVDHASRPVVGLFPQMGDAETFPQALGLKSLDPFLIDTPRHDSLSKTIL